MTARQRAEDKQRRLQLAMWSLVGDDRFSKFIDTIREFREESTNYAVSNDSVKSERKTLAALGEIRAYNEIIDLAEQHAERIAEMAEQEAEEKAQIAAEQAQ